MDKPAMQTGGYNRQAGVHCKKAEQQISYFNSFTWFLICLPSESFPNRSRVLLNLLASTSRNMDTEGLELTKSSWKSLNFLGKIEPYSDRKRICNDSNRNLYKVPSGAATSKAERVASSTATFWCGTSTAALADAIQASTKDRVGESLSRDFYSVH